MARCAPTSRSSSTSFRVPKKPVILATSRGQWSKVARAKPCASSTIPSSADRYAFTSCAPARDLARFANRAEELFTAAGCEPRQKWIFECRASFSTGHGPQAGNPHEPPRVGATPRAFLKRAMSSPWNWAFTCPAIGGVRLEDVTHITPQNPRNLTQFENVLEV